MSGYEIIGLVGMLVIAAGLAVVVLEMSGVHLFQKKS